MSFRMARWVLACVLTLVAYFAPHVTWLSAIVWIGEYLLHFSDRHLEHKSAQADTETHSKIATLEKALEDLLSKHSNLSSSVSFLKSSAPKAPR